MKTRSNKRRSPKKPKHLFRRFLWRIFAASLSLLITVIIALGVFYFYIELQLPDISVLKDLHLQVPLRVFSKDGKLLAEYGEKKRIPVTLNQVPKSMVAAVLATEDARFYSHPGIDFIGLVRAAVAVVQSGRKVQGASTITMQVARNFFLNSEKTFDRKIREILLALKIDNEFSKDKILELYLNKVYFGQHAYGVAAAAHVYYGKTLNQLTLPEVALIAGLPQAPSRDNPLNNPEAALKRRNHVLDRMLEVGFINQAQRDKAVKAPLKISYHGESTGANAPYVAEMVRQEMVAKFGDSAYDQGFMVYTTISSELQKYANQALQNGLIAFSNRHGWRKPTLHFGRPRAANRSRWQEALRMMRSVNGLIPAAVLRTGTTSITALLANGTSITIPWSGLSWARPAISNGYVGESPRQASDIAAPGDVIWVTQKDSGWKLAQTPKIQGAIVAMNPQNGAILALSGGFDYNISSFNRATQAQRQPGSNFKPFLYSAALEKGFTLATTINDAPVVIKQSGDAGYWRPMNAEMKFYGPTRLRIGLVKSRNLVSIRLLQDIGISYAVKYISRFGFDPNKLPKSLSLALGTGVTTPVQVASGYSVFANGGYRVTPYYIEKITDQKNQLIYEANPPQACSACITDPNPTADQLPKTLAPQIISSQNAYLITSALKDVIQYGTGFDAKKLNRKDIAGKTGTNQLVDAWFSGFNSDIETTVWVGYDDFKPIYEYAAKAALPIWMDFMSAALKGKPERSMPMPPNIVTARIDPVTGFLATPEQRNAINELFKNQETPQEYSTENTDPTQASGPSSAGGNSGAEENEPLF